MLEEVVVVSLDRVAGVVDRMQGLGKGPGKGLEEAGDLEDAETVA